MTNRSELNSVANALHKAGMDYGTLPRARARVTVGVEAMAIGAALLSCEQPTGPLLREIQGQADLALARRHVRKLVARMAADGKDVSETAQAHAVADACAALAIWRAGLELTRHDGEDIATPAGAGEALDARRVCWRAVVDSVSDDNLGESAPINTVQDDWLFPAQSPDASRRERVSRMLVERQAARRAKLAMRRIEHVREASKPTGRGGRRSDVAGKLARAVEAMLHGATLDDAAMVAGFTASGRTSASSRLVQACKRLGLVVGWRRDARARA
jgi:hypothetical protein